MCQIQVQVASESFSDAGKSEETAMSRLGGMRPRSRYRFGAQEAPDHGMYANTVIRLILHLCSESCAPFPVLCCGFSAVVPLRELREEIRLAVPSLL